MVAATALGTHNFTNDRNFSIITQYYHSMVQAHEIFTVASLNAARATETVESERLVWFPSERTTCEDGKQKGSDKLVRLCQSVKCYLSRCEKMQSTNVAFKTLDT